MNGRHDPVPTIIIIGLGLYVLEESDEWHYQ
eukprot:COSAG02_NODE_15241_length_1190_cov_162.677360_2_plen_31_part_00